jgi:hypothetical protein
VEYTYFVADIRVPYAVSLRYSVCRISTYLLDQLGKDFLPLVDLPDVPYLK